MRKNLLIILIFYVLGIIMSSSLSVGIGILYITTGILVAAILKLFFKFNIKILIGTISFALGFIVSVSVADISTYRYSDYFNTKSDILCQIVSGSEDKAEYVKYEAKIIKDGKKVGAPISLNVNNKYSNEFYNYGDTLLIKNAKLVSYKHYKSFQNLASSGKYASIFTYDYNIDKLPKEETNFIVESIFKLRSSIINMCDKYLSKDVSSVVKAITIAEKSDLAEEVKDNFSKSGLSHLLAISGFHLSVLVSYAEYFFLMFKTKKRYILELTIRVLICTLMIIITGCQPSVVRASIMLIMASTAKIFYREYDSETALLTAGSIIVIINPFSIYDVGFLLSFFATLGIIVLSPKISGVISKNIKSKYISDSVCITICAQIAIFPILVIAFNTVQLLSFFANLIAVPIFTFLFICSLIFIVLSHIAPFLLPIVSGLVYLSGKAIVFIALLFAKIPFSSIDVTGVYFIMDVLLAAAALLAGTVFFKTKKKIEKTVSAVLVLVLMVSVFLMKNGDENIKNILPNSNVSTNLKVSFLDVGQGDCALVQAHEKALLIDGGSSSDENIGKNKIKPYLLSNGISRLDYAVVSHYHEDHYSGILYLLDNFEVGTLVLTGASNSEDYDEKELLTDAAERNGIPIYYFYENDAIKLSDDTVLTAYSPLRNITYSSNDESLVLKLENPNISFMFTGDIERSGENKLKSVNLKADVLKVAHHGSNTSSTDAFLNNVNPKYAVISCGKNNMYSHPHDEVIERLEKRNIKYYRTDEIGDIVFYVSKDGKLNIN